ncbi:MAG: hypothetical protein KDE27_10940 [Planctomycetes bacterium]|nr:hypothetical protein [Planctomycetota bacterium]
MPFTSCSCIPLATAVLSVAAPAAAQASFHEAFAGPTIDATLALRTDPGFASALTAGGLDLWSASATPAGRASLETTFLALGDFTATIAITAHDLGDHGRLGLTTLHELGVTEIGFRGPDNVTSTIAVGPGFGSAAAPALNQPATFRIRRTGATIQTEIDQGAGFAVVHGATDPSLATPVRIGVFLQREPGGARSLAATVDDFAITAAAFAPSATSMLYGHGVPGTGNVVPRLGADPLFPGRPLAIAFYGGRGGALAALSLGLQATSQPYLGGTLLVAGPTFDFVLLLDGAAGTAGTGMGTLTVPLPYATDWFGASLYGQGGVFDPAAAFGVALTAGLEMQFPRY